MYMILSVDEIQVADEIQGAAALAIAWSLSHVPGIGVGLHREVLYHLCCWGRLLDSALRHSQYISACIGRLGEDMRGLSR